MKVNKKKEGRKSYNQLLVLPLWNFSLSFVRSFRKLATKFPHLWRFECSISALGYTNFFSVFLSTFFYSVSRLFSFSFLDFLFPSVFWTRFIQLCRTQPQTGQGRLSVPFCRNSHFLMHFFFVSVHHDTLFFAFTAKALQSLSPLENC